MWKVSALKTTIVDGALVRIIQLVAAASESRTIGNHGDGLTVDAMVEAVDHDCIILGP